VQIPGVEGQNGQNGLDGVSAFTFTTANFVVPAIGSSVTISAIQNAFIAVGQNVFVQGAGTFTCTGLPTTTTIALTYLNYDSNTAAGSTINTGAKVSIGGYQPATQTLLPALSNYHVAGAQNLTNTPAQLLTSSVVLSAGTYLLLSGARIDFSGTTFAAPQTITVKLRETNNGPADIANAVEVVNTGTPTTITETFWAGQLPAKVYTAAQNDTVQVFGTVSAAPGAGNVVAVEAWILAIKLF
jgi:hypothetical protein